MDGQKCNKKWTEMQEEMINKNTGKYIGKSKKTSIV